MPPSPASAPRRVEDATCTYCTCMCDDIALTVENNQIVEVENACGLGKAWFMRPRPEEAPACTIEGREATIDEGIEQELRRLTEIFGTQDAYVGLSSLGRARPTFTGK